MYIYIFIFLYHVLYFHMYMIQNEVNHILWLISVDQDKPMTKSTESAVNTTLWILRTAAWSVICNIKKKGFYLSLPWHGQGFSVSASEFQFAVLYKRLVHLYDWSFNTDILKKHTKASVFFFGVLILCRGPVQSSFLTIPHGVNLNAAKVLAVFQSHVGLLHLHGKW